MTKRTIIILTLNEVDGVRWLLDEGPNLFEMAEEVVAVDGGSTDGTRELLEAADIRVIGQEIKGRGEAFRVGVNATRGENLVFFSPDGNENPMDIPKLFDALKEGAEVAVASRFLPGSKNEEDGDLLPLRKWGNMFFTFLANISWNRGAYISDTINGFRGVSRDIFLDLKLASLGYSIEYEMTIRAMKQEMKVVEIPTIESQRVGGCTKAPTLRTGLRFLLLFLKEFS